MTDYSIYLSIPNASINQLITAVSVSSTYETLFATAMSALAVLIAADPTKITLISLFKDVFEGLL